MGDAKIIKEQDSNLSQGVTGVKCNRCGHDISQDESYSYLSETLCEDCYMDVKQPANPCDPWAVFTATRSRERSGFKGVEGLTPLQTAIYEFVKSKGKTTGEEVMENFNIPQRELERQLALLRHCELIKGHKEGDTVYLVLFGS
jgi:transcription initiation factor IIE alpha subunit